MTYLTVDNFHIYSILGEETHIKCALYLMIKVSFGIVYANKEKDWAKLTLSGLNRVMNFNEIMRKDGKKCMNHSICVTKSRFEWKTCK